MRSHTPHTASVQRFRSTTAGLWGLVFAALAACTETPPGTDGTGTGTSQLPCSTDAECASAKLVCDRVRRSCVCTKDAMCEGNPDGPYCNAFTGRCVKDVAGCKGDAECGPNEFCDAAIRTCRSKKTWCQPCSQDEECGGAGDHCVHHPDFASSPAFCATACGESDSCPAGQACRDTERGRQCIPAVGRCTANSSCVPDTLQQCSRDADCSQGIGQVCDLQISRCVAAQTTCAAGQSCDPVTLQCVQACRFDRDCVERFGDPNYTCLNNTCLRSETCYKDQDCPQSKWCFKEPGKLETDPGVCQPACNSDAECPLGERCINNAFTGRRRCIAGCDSATNAGCPLTAICTGGQCEYSTAAGAQRCQVKEVCGFRESCQANTCLLQPDHCKSCAAGCGAGACATLYSNIQCGTPACPGGVRPYCEPNASCGGQLCGCPIQRCVYRCSSDSQCPKGFACTQLPVNNNFGPWCVPIDAGLCR